MNAAFSSNKYFPEKIIKFHTTFGNILEKNEIFKKKYVFWEKKLL